MVDEGNHCSFLHTEPWKTNTGKLIWKWGSKINEKEVNSSLKKTRITDGWIFQML